MDPQTYTEKSLEELIKELPRELHPAARESIEVLLADYAAHGRATEAPDPGPDAQVALRAITADTVHTICKLSDTLTPPKKYMVAPNAVSIAEAYFEPKAWLRAIYADETPIGFVMLYDDPGDPPGHNPDYFLWRLMIAGPHQGKGYGRRAIELLVEYVKTRPGARELEVSCGQGPGSPEGFYRKLGFERTGKMFEGEVGLSLAL